MKRLLLSDADTDRALALRQGGASYRAIGLALGCCEASASNAVMAAECRAAGYTPARRDSAGTIIAPDVEKMRTMMRAGARSVDIQRRLGVSASTVSHHRRVYAADLKARGKRPLPVPGGGEAYCGRRIPPAERRAAEALFLAGFGTAKVSARVGISKTQSGRIRNRLIKRLARKGEALPGCDRDGRRVAQKESTRFIPAEAIAAFNAALLARQPVRRAAAANGIGTSSAYRLRDALAAKLTARGEALPPPILPGKASASLSRAAAARWLPPGQILRYRALSIEHGAARAKEILLQEQAERRRAERARPKSFEEQLAAVARGAPLQQRFVPQRLGPDITLGGIATAAL